MRKLNVGLIGVGRMGAFHGETLAKRLVNVNVTAVADPLLGAAEKFIENNHIAEAIAYTNPLDLINDERVEAVVIASPARTHAMNVLATIKQGKAVFCEKPMAVNMEEAKQIVDEVNKRKAFIQVGFNRRFERGFKEAHEEVLKGNIGVPQLIKSTTRDPKLNNAEAIPAWTIFLETLIHDFDTLMFLNPGAKPIEVYAAADALIRPDLKEAGLLDTAVVTVKFDNGAIATAEASFQAVYGYDIRAEVFGTKGMLTAGDIRRNSLTKYYEDNINHVAHRYDQDLLFDAYVAEMASFVENVLDEKPSSVNEQDATSALSIALACVESVKENRPIKINEANKLLSI